MSFSEENRFGFDGAKNIEVFKKRLQCLGCDKKIIITGPQRSGTRITAKIIADIFQIPHIDEEIYKFNWTFLRLKTANDKTYAVHSPAIMHRAWDAPKDVAIVVSVRNIDDIIASQKRIMWGGEYYEKKKFKKIAGIDINQPISKIKYDYAELMKDERTMFIKRGFFSEHPFWLPKKNRKDFMANQTKI